MTQISKFLESNIKAVFLQFAKTPGVRIVREPDCIRIYSGCKVSWMNGVLWSAFAPDTVLARTKEIIVEIGAHCVSAVWRVGPLTTHREKLVQTLIDGGLTCSQYPGLVLNLESFQAPSSALRIEKLRTSAQITYWLVPFKSSFELPQTDCDFYHAYLLQCLKNDSQAFVHFIGYHCNQPVSCISTFSEGQFAGIYNLATLHQFRRCGFGASMTNHALQYLKRTGHTHAGLLDESDSVSIYAQIGFQKIAEFTVFEMTDVDSLLRT